MWCDHPVCVCVYSISASEPDFSIFLINPEFANRRQSAAFLPFFSPKHLCFNNVILIDLWLTLNCYHYAGFSANSLYFLVR